MAVSKAFSLFMVALLFGLAVAQSPSAAPSPSPSALFNRPTRSPSASPSPAPTTFTAPSPATSSPTPPPTSFSPPSPPPSAASPSPSFAVPPSAGDAPVPSPNAAALNKVGLSAASVAVLLAVALVA